MTDEARRISPVFDSTRDAYEWLTTTDNENQGAAVDRIIERDTPTNDERTNKSMDLTVYEVLGDWPQSHEVVDALIEEGHFRRSEVPEPSTEDRSHEFANMAATMGIPEPSAWVGTEFTPGHPMQIVRKPQGEPSDARGRYTDAQMLYMLCLALEEGLEGIKHAEDLNVLLVKMIAEHWGTADEDTSPDEAEAAFAQLAPYIPDHLRTAASIVTEQGEEQNHG